MKSWKFVLLLEVGALEILEIRGQIPVEGLRGTVSFVRHDAAID